MEEIMIVLPGETEDECLTRIAEAKRDGFLDLHWPEISDWFNKTFRQDETEYRTESSYRKKAKNFLKSKDMTEKKYAADNNIIDEFMEKKRAIEKEKIKLRDERTDYQKSIREEARRESFVELIERAFAINVAPFDYKPSPIIDSNEDMVVCLSDLHAGIEVQNWWNTYNTGILRQRLHKYLDEV